MAVCLAGGVCMGGVFPGGLPRGMSTQGGVYPIPGPRGRHPHWTDERLRKHYLFATTVADSVNVTCDTK